MLQKIHWLGQIQNEHIQTTQECRTLFCKQEFPHLTFICPPAFVMVGGGLVSNTYPGFLTNLLITSQKPYVAYV